MPTVAAPPGPPPPLPDLETLRAVTLDQTILIGAAVLTVSGALAFYRNLAIGWNPLVFVHFLITPVLLWSLVLARPRLSYRWKAVLFILFLWALAINALTMVGPVANAKAAIILIVLVSMLFLSPRAGWFNVAVGALILATIGAAAVTGRLAFPIDYPNYVKTPAVWVQTVFSFTAYSAVTALIAARLLHSLDATIQALATQTAALRATQARLRTALDHQRAIFNNSSAGIALIDGARTIVEANPRFCALLGYHAADLIGQSTRLIHRDDTAFAAVAARCYVPPGPAGAYSEDIQLRRRDGTLLWTHASLSPLDPAAPGAGAVLVLVDIDQRKRIELALAVAKHQAESATRAKSRFLATVTHELRTPLHAILGFAEVLGRLEARDGEADGDADEAPLETAAKRRRDLFATIQRNGRHLLSLINEVLDFSRLERGRLTLEARPTALPALLCDCVGDLGPLAAAKGLALHLDTGSGLPPCVWLDGRRLTQVLTNLLGNALAHTQAGEVRLSAATTPDPAAPDRVELRLTVADTGPGIPAAEQARIFAAFVQAEPDGAASPGTALGGSGLGLNISRKLVRQMGGRIELDSAPGAGSRFTVILPAVALARAGDCAGTAAASPDAQEATATPAAAPPPAPPPPEALAELRTLADLGRTTRIEAWCRHWSTPEGRPDFAAEVLALAHAFEHARIIALVDAQAGHTGQRPGL